MLKEEFLYYVWKFRIFNHDSLISETGENIRIMHPGERNSDAGPDFTNARILVGDTEWAGNVEIHLKSSDWNRHGHDADASFDNIVLHVVYENDAPVKRTSGEVIPALELKNRIDPRLLGSYLSLVNSKEVVPCQNRIREIDPFHVTLWLERLLIERLERKSSIITKTLESVNNSIEEAFYIHLASNFGFKLNALPFELVAKSLPLSIVAKHRGDLFVMEALFLGQAGLIPENCHDEYAASLRKEYNFLSKKYSLKPLQNHLWKFLRSRPANFPSIRMAQFAAIMNTHPHLFASLTACESAEEVNNLLRISCSKYWEEHYVFGKKVESKSAFIGHSSLENLIINTIAPFLFIYYKLKDNDLYLNRALALLQNTKAEKNVITNLFSELGIQQENAGQSQAVIELNNEYCNHKKCINCGIGIRILKH